MEIKSDIFINLKIGMAENVLRKQSEGTFFDKDGEAVETLAVVTPTGIWTGVNSNYIYRPIQWIDYSDVSPILNQDTPTLNPRMGLWVIGFTNHVLRERMS